ncbi:Acetyltransferase (GNAT) family protein [Nonomuraea maritima]|jgi:ribosomal protein S18 acetylase RimI-like enzyme|uniref:Acetyltransferase (GNAT) family protein n=1 Tax=Nonomuraea maritima TaxID=683260 RepID=A0A1G9PDC6_9ACTN|nr:GNAT family N-acetyltransferase [Nonomuraea maritima]SDL96758.1 Acetyltransferase (GNAT) family protein [Nonomuraea maritima]
MKLAIRRYRWSDLDTILALHRICLAEVGLVPGDGVYYDDDFPRIQEIYLGPGGDFLVGEADSRVVAMGGLKPVDTDTAEICRLRVHPEFQRRGFGAAMLAALEQRAVELGFGSVRGDTTLNQQAALGLYARQGWRELSRQRVGDLVVVYIEKRLVPPAVVER